MEILVGLMLFTLLAVFALFDRMKNIKTVTAVEYDEPKCDCECGCEYI